MDEGQLLVLRGDLTKLRCDAVVVPTSAALQVTEHWTDLVPVRGRDPRTGWFDVDLPRAADWGREDRCLLAPRQDEADVWLVRTDGHGRPGEFVAAAVEQAVLRYGPRLNSTRARPLVGLPLVGTGTGGFRGRQGEVVAALVPVLERSARAAGVDLALVLRDEQDVAAVQAVRSGQTALDDREQAEADRLGRLAHEGKLVLFLGAGVSIAAGLPAWDGLLRELAGRSPKLHGLDLTRLDPRDAAQLAHDALGPAEFKSFMRERFTSTQHSLAHALLAGLHVEAAVTTNYDNAYELAHEGLGPEADLRVLPKQRAQPGLPWLLKLHGDAVEAEDIVLTRAQYVEHAESRAPLTGLVQSLLMTRHMLFVGFSLTDDGFARLAHQVRRMMSGQSEPVGTVLSLEPDRARELLWEEDLTFVTLGEQGGTSAAARRLELFLDRVGCVAARARGGAERYLLDPRYAALATSPADVALKQALESLVQGLPDDARESGSWPVVRDALRRLGRPGPW